MMEVEKPWDLKEDLVHHILEDEEEEEEEDNGNSAAAAGGLDQLQTRESRRRTKEKTPDLPEPAGTNDDDAAAEEEHTDKSVFFHPTKGVENEVTEAVQVGGQKENSTESSIAEGKETNHHSSNGKLENGSHSNGVHEISSGSEIVTIADGEAGLNLIATIVKGKNILPNFSEALDISNGSMNSTEIHEVEVVKGEHDTNDKAKIEEYDLEKILDEQETHDLYCPNCNSCITRRVILKKRKRTVREAKRDEHPKRPQLEEFSANISNQPAAEIRDQESLDVFRCLSCFTFFIPTGCGFNIFRIFKSRDANEQVMVQQSSASHETSENCGSWLLSCFQAVDSPKKPADADTLKEPLLSGLHVDDKTSVEDGTSSAYSNATVNIAEQLKIPLPAGSSTIIQETTENNEEEITQSVNEFRGTASSIVTVHTSSSSTSKISFWQSKPDMGENTAAVSENSSLFNQAIFKPELKVPTKDISEVGNLTTEKPISVIPLPVQSEGTDHVAVLVRDGAVMEPVLEPVPAPAETEEWDILKAIVYGGLVESITSLSVVSAAAASGANSLNIFVLGMANLIGGLPIIFHNISDLRNKGDVAESSEQVGHYRLELGRRSNYRLHMVIAILSYILIGLLPPVIYGLSFRKSDNRENKMMLVAAASLVCIGLLAIGKAHVNRPRTYITTLLYYLSLGFSGSGLSYVAGVLITMLLAHFGIIDQAQGGSSPPAPPTLLFPHTAATWASF